MHGAISRLQLPRKSCCPGQGDFAQQNGEAASGANKLA